MVGRRPASRLNGTGVRTKGGRRAARSGGGATAPAWPLLALVALVPVVFDPWGWDRFGPGKWLLCAGVVLAWALRTARDKAVVHCRPITFAWVALLVTSTAATILAPDPLLAFLGEGSRLYGLASFVLVFGVYLVGCSAGPGKSTIVVRALVAGATMVVCYGLVQMAGWDPIRWSASLDVSRARSTLGNAAYLGGYLTLVLPVAALQWANAGEPRRWRVVHGATFVGGLVVMAGSGTRGSWVGLVVGFGVCAWLGRRFFAGGRDETRRGVVAGLVVATVAAVAVAGLLTPLGPRALSTFDPSSGTAAGRLATWADTVRLVRERPVLGWGPEGFRIGFARVVSREWVERYGQEQIQDRAHNLFLDTASTLGIVGLAAYSALLLALLQTARRAVRSGGRELVGISAGLAGYLVHAQFVFETFDLSVLFWALAGVLAAEAGPRVTWRLRAPFVLRAGSALAAAAVGLGVLGVVANHRVGGAIPDRPGAVVAALADAAELRPRSLEYYLLAGRVAIDSDDAAALRRAHQLLGSWPDRDVRLSHAGVLTKLGAKTGQTELLRDAATIYEAIVEQEPFAGLAWLGLGEVRLRLGQGFEARRALLQAAPLLPRSPDPALALGFLALSEGRRSEAGQHLEQARRLAPDDLRVADLQQELERG
jgi:O-antigen ligase